MENMKISGQKGYRISAVDAAKGVGILIVILGHILNEDYQVLAKVIFSFHMPLFFILSGIVLKNIREGGATSIIS